MAAREGYDWPRSPPLAPDTSSPIYLDRPIRPLPKRRLRDRLSADAAEFMLPKEPTQQSLFSFPYVQPEKDAGMTAKLRGGEPRRSSYSCADCAREHDDHSDIESDEGGHHRHPYPPPFAHTGYDGAGGSRTNPPPPDSTASSADGYESFENTNNKKKRKIPQSNGLGAHSSHALLASDLANLGLTPRDGEPSTPDEASPVVGSYYGSGSAVMPSGTSGTGLSVSGAGRGRFGRPRGPLDRRPLSALTNGLNASVGRVRPGTYGTGKVPTQSQSQGIISAAIANAAQQASLTQKHGNENVSLLQQQASKSPPQKTDFTFQSDAVSKFAWPGPQQSDLPPPPMVPHGAIPARGGLHTQATQTSPNINGGQGNRSQVQQGHHTATTQGGQHRGGVPPAKPDKPKKPRSLGRILEINARRRKMQQQYQNFHSPPRREDVWVCEFCEYEDIFGVPPRALIRRYEEKDRAEQKRIAEKRRLLEKAKAKGRKGKKGTKNSKNNSNQASATQHPRYDPPDDYVNDDDYYDDDVDDDPISIPPTPQPGQSPGAYPTSGAHTAKHISQAAHAHHPPPQLQKGHSVGHAAPPVKANAA